MRVQRLTTTSGSDSWTVVDDKYRVVEPVESYLAFLTSIGRSPNTVRSYAYSLGAWWSHLERNGCPWDGGGLVQVLANFAAEQLSGRGNVIAINGDLARTRRTVNLRLAAIHGFYAFQSMNGVEVLPTLLSGAAGPRTAYKPFLYGLASASTPRHMVRFREPQRIVEHLPLDEAITVIACQERLRDKFLFALLLLTGLRIGQALGLRHEDIVSWDREVRVFARPDNANGARAKATPGQLVTTVPVTHELIRLYSDYMHEEYGDLDSDYVFVNLWAGEIGSPMTYSAVNGLARRTRARTGIDFTPHRLRHTYATVARKAGVSIDVISKLLGHTNVTSTQTIYAHIDPELIRQELEAAGVLREHLEGLLS